MIRAGGSGWIRAMTHLTPSILDTIPLVVLLMIVAAAAVADAVAAAVVEDAIDCYRSNSYF